MRKKKTEISVEQINKNARRQIAAVVIVGAFVLISDIISGASGGNITVIKSDGHMYMLRPDKNGETGYLYLNAEVETENGSVNKNINVKLDPYEEKTNGNEKQNEEVLKSEVSEDERIGYELRNIASSFNNDVSIKRIELPSSLDTGEKVTWEIDEQSNAMLIIVSVMMLSVVIYRNRYAPLKKERKNHWTYYRNSNR